MCMLCFVLINSILLNLSCVQVVASAGKNFEQANQRVIFDKVHTIIMARKVEGGGSGADRFWILNAQSTMKTGSLTDSEY